MFVMNLQKSIMVMVVVLPIDIICNDSVPGLIQKRVSAMEYLDLVMKLHITPMIMLLLLQIHDLRCVLGQFYQHADVLRNAEGLVFAHYDSVQYGAQRLYCTDGSSVLSTHSLFRVQDLAVDTVRLVGVHPTILKGKFVELPLVVYDVMFKLVSGQSSDCIQKPLWVWRL